MRLPAPITRTLALAVLQLSLAIVVAHAQFEGGIWRPAAGPYGGTISSLIYTAGGAMIVGTPAGLYRSSDNGSNWLQGFMPIAPVYALARDSAGVLYAATMSGIFRSTDGAMTWQEVSEEGGPARFGFAIAVADDNPDQAWVAPADSDEIRTAIKGSLFICRTDDGGKTWKQLRKGLPQENCFDIVYRHALVSAGEAVAFGTTTGNLFFSRDRGESWEVINNYLPMIYSVQFVD